MTKSEFIDQLNHTSQGIGRVGRALDSGDVATGQAALELRALQKQLDDLWGSYLMGEVREA